MCGICGVVFHERARPVDVRLLARMMATMTHRGPDSEGHHAGDGVGLGVRRLSIIDIEGGHQPICNEDRTVIAICNGEIYNHIELRRDLTSRGHRFRTLSDAEVIVHLYEEHGLEFVGHLRGMFGLALWDVRLRRLMLARDRFGIKPLHYAMTPAGLWFASEQKAILAAGAAAPEPDLQALRQLFTYGRVVSPRTFVRGIRRLPAAHRLTWTDGATVIERYWDVTFPDRHAYDTQTSEADWAEALREKLTEAVRLHLRSDVPVGTWLSAGIDSSAITAFASRLIAGPVPTFTLRFDDPTFDELRDQKGLDDFPEYGLAGHRISCGPSDLQRLPEAVWHCEDPQMTGIGLGRLLIAEATRPHLKVVLTGEGSDEILGGYSWYPEQRVLAPAFLLPKPVRRLVTAVPAVRRRWPGAARTLAGPRDVTFERYWRTISPLRSHHTGADVFSTDLMDRLRGEGEIDDTPPLPPAFATWHPFAKMQYFDITVRLADAIVADLDRGAMAHSVETRVPFLDHELVELCGRIPPAFKIKRLREKHLLRRALQGVLPPEIIRRRKRPMRVPLGRWLRGVLPAFAADHLSSTALEEAGYFDPARVTALLQRHRQGREDLGPLLAGVLNVQIWHQLFRVHRS